MKNLNKENDKLTKLLLGKSLGFNDYISKDKIREKIEELDSIYQQEIKQQYNGRYYHQLSYAIQELKSLLKE